MSTSTHTTRDPTLEQLSHVNRLPRRHADLPCARGGVSSRLLLAGSSSDAALAGATWMGCDRCGGEERESAAREAEAVCSDVGLHAHQQDHRRVSRDVHRAGGGIAGVAKPASGPARRRAPAVLGGGRALRGVVSLGDSSCATSTTPPMPSGSKFRSWVSSLVTQPGTKQISVRPLPPFPNQYSRKFQSRGPQ